MNEFLLMDGYGKYVWGSFAISFVVLTMVIALGKRQLARTQANIVKRINMTGSKL